MSLVSCVGVGNSVITASFAGMSGTSNLTVSAAILTSIAVLPGDPSVAKGLSQQFTANGTYSDGTTQDITTAVTWASSNTQTVAISNASGSKGMASCLGTGDVVISATQGNTRGISKLTVTEATLASIAILPAAPIVSKNHTLQLTARGTFSDNTTQDLTAAVTWVASDTDICTVSNADGSKGLVTALADPGDSDISASLNGITGTTPLTVAETVCGNNICESGRGETAGGCPTDCGGKDVTLNLTGVLPSKTIDIQCSSNCEAGSWFQQNTCNSKPVTESHTFRLNPGECQSTTIQHSETCDGGGTSRYCDLWVRTDCLYYCTTRCNGRHQLDN